MSDERAGGDAATDGGEEAATDGGEDAPPIESVDEDFADVRVAVGEHGERVATVTIDRPEARNALSGRVRRELTAAFEAAEAADDVRVVVLTGSDEAKAFIAGADVTELREHDAQQQRAASKRVRVYEAVEGCSKPVIARINGHCLGGGNELALACDVRIADERAKLGQPEINLGIIPGGGATQRLPRLVGEGHAMRLILSGELVDATEAAELGMVEAAVAPEELDDRVTDIAESMATKSPVALRMAKEAVRAAGRFPLEQGIAYETELFVQLFDTHDKNEGIDAFLEDREPEWEGR